MFEKYNPIQYYIGLGWRITSNYGPRIHPISKKQSFHNGVDLVKATGPRNIPVPIPYSGMVWRAQFYRSRGYTVIVKIEGTNQMMLFQHLQYITVQIGQRLRIGDSVGICGTSGDSTGVHLHFEIREFDGQTALGSKVWGNPNHYYHNNKGVIDIWKGMRDQMQLRLRERIFIPRLK